MPHHAPCIAHLPAELVHSIFRYLYEDARPISQFWHFRREWEGNTSASPTDADCKWESVSGRTPNFFPFNVALTCRTWLSISCDTPAYWTRLYINVGHGATPLVAVKQFLEASRNSLITEVIVMRDDYSVDDESEREQVAAVTKLVVPHIRRIKMLEFDLIHVDSLPTPCKDICGVAAVLEGLTLSARRGTVDGKLRPSVKCTAKLQCPALKRVTADADVFYDGFARGSKSLLYMPCLLQLTLRRTHPRGADGRVRKLSIDRFMHAFTLDTRGKCCLAWLALEEIAFRRSKLQDKPRPFADTEFYLKKLAATALADTLAYRRGNARLRDVTIEGCRIAQFATYVNTHTLYLKDPAPEDDPMPLLRSVDVSILDITNCPRLTDDGLAELSYGGEDDEDWLSPNLTSLVLKDCPHVTLTGVRRLAKSRLDAHERLGNPSRGNLDQPLSFVNFIYLSGCGHAGDEDLKWLEANVPRFHIKEEE